MKKNKIPPYRIVVDWSEEDQVFIARVPELDGVVTHGETQIEAMEMAHEAIELHLESLKAHNEQIPKAAALQDLKGNFSLRMGPERHKDVFIAAKAKGQSVNEYLCSVIDASIRPQPMDDVGVFGKIFMNALGEYKSTVHANYSCSNDWFDAFASIGKTPVTPEHSVVYTIVVPETKQGQTAVGKALEQLKGFVKHEPDGRITERRTTKKMAMPR